MFSKTIVVDLFIPGACDFPIQGLLTRFAEPIMRYLLWNGSQTQPEKQLVTTIVFILVFHSRAYLETWIIIIVL